MIIFISAQGPTIESPKDDRFGRCRWLIKVNSETQEWQAFENPGVNQSGGAGVAAAQFVVDQKADVVISGSFGPNASSTFRAAKIEMRTFGRDISTAQQAVDAYLQGNLTVFG